MGASQSLRFDDHFTDPRSWSLTMVEEVRQVWREQLAMTFGISKAQLHQMLTTPAFSAGRDLAPLIDGIWSALNPEDSELIDALGVITTFAIVSQGPLDDKVDMVFDTFDFNGNASISEDELTILCMASLLGMVRYYYPGTPVPSDARFEEFSVKAMTSIDADTNKNISRDEFHKFVSSELDADQSGALSAEEFLSYFGVLIKDPATAEVDGEGDAGMGAGEDSLVDPDLDAEGAAMPKPVDPNDVGFDVFEMEADTGGDEFMAVKPWIGAIVAPSDPPSAPNASPDADLDLAWVYGYRCFDARNNVRRLASGEIVYHTAAVGVVYDPEAHEQRHYFGHTDDIVSLAVHPDGKTVATGQMGKRPTIHVWDTTAEPGKQLIVSLKARSLQRAVLHLAFSADGTKLAAVGQDADHTLHVFKDWTKGRRGGMMTIETDKNKILDMAFNDTTVITVGVKHVKFWDAAGRRLRGKRGLLGSGKGKIQPVVSAAWFQDKAVTGTVSGHLYVWNGPEIESVVRGHRGTVNSLYSAGDVLLSGGKDGKINVWNAAFNRIKCIETKDRVVRSVMANDGGAGVLAGLANADIVTYDEEDAESLLHQGHYYGELWGLSTHPSEPQFVTTGDDRFLRVWDATEHKCIRSIKLDSYVRAVAYSPDGSKIAVGTGGRLGGIIPEINGAFFVLDAESLEIVGQGQDSKRWIQEIKWSPDGRTLAVGSHDSNIYLYQGSGDYPLKNTCEGHNSYITHIDFTADSKFLQSNCGAYELLFWDASTGEQNPSGASELKDAEWASWTCTLGWPVQGIWPPFADGTDVNSVDRDHGGKLLATADDFGNVKLFNYPNTAAGWMSSAYSGHSSHVTNVRWAHDDSYLVSVGGNDKSVFQWDMDRDEVDECEVAEEDADPLLAFESTQVAAANDAAPSSSGMDFAFSMEDDAGGDEFMAVKPWIGAIVEPSSTGDINAGEPDLELQLDWVHGYQAQVMRDSLRFSADGKLVYTSAAVGIVYDREAHSQAFFRGPPRDDIMSFAISKDRTTVAVGEMGRRPFIFIWDVASQKLIRKLAGHKRGVSALAFSYDGNRLASVGMDNDHTVLVHDLTSGDCVGKQKGDTNRILSVEWAPSDDFFVTVGVRHMYFWYNKRRGSLRQRRGLIGGSGKRQTFICVDIPESSNPHVGCNDGSVYVFNGDTRSLDAVREGAHDGPVYSIVSPAGLILTGGRDGKVRSWGADLAEATEFDIGTAVRSVDVSSDGTTLLVGTVESQIYVQDLATAGAEKVLLASAHYHGETWGLATHPSKPEYVTTGDDGTVRVWSLATHRLLKETKLETLTRAAAYSPDGSLIAVALGGRLGGKEEGPTGQVQILNGETMDAVHTMKDTEQWIQDVKFSPDGTRLAVASHDNKIYLYDATATDWDLVATLTGHSSYITHIDFTADSKFLQSNCGAYELLFWNVETGEQDPSGASNLKDAEWASWTCTLGWPVQGIWPAYADGTDVNSVDRAHGGRLLATGDDSSRVKLFNYPANTAGAGSVTTVGHSSHVTNVRWSHDDGYLLSTGGNDRAVFQWRGAKDDAEVIDVDDSDLEVETNIPERSDAQEAANAGFTFEMEADAGGDEFMAVKPWIGAIVEPSDPPPAINEDPMAHVELEWVHGFRAFDTRSNLFYLASGQVAYHAAAVGVVYDKESHAQRFYHGHTDDIVCLAVHPNGRTVATGQMGKRPTIHVWDSTTMETLKVLKGFHKRAVSNVRFSPDGSFIISVGADNDHSLALYDWKRGSSIPKSRRARKAMRHRFAKGHTDKLLDVAYGNKDVCVVGIRAAKIFSQSSLRMKKVLMNGIGKLQPFVSVAFFQDKYVIGTVTGDLYVVEDHKVVDSIRAHDGTVNTLFAHGDVLVSGSKDGGVKVWNSSFEASAEYNFKYFESQDQKVRSVARNADGVLLVGTQGAEIYELSAAGDATKLSEAHYYGELWGLATHPNADTYITTGDDSYLRVWDVAARKQVGKTKFDTLARAASYSPDGSLIAVGLGGRLGGKEDGPVGQFHVLDATSLEVVHTGKDSEQWIQDVKFSPDGATLAVASHDNKIYLYDVAGGYSLKATCSGHSSYITHIDFTADSQFLQSTCGAYELLFWNVETGEQNPSGASELKDAEWASWTCTLGWPVQGIWPAYADGTDINSVDRAHAGTVLATADDFGNVKLFNYPNLSAGWASSKFTGHSSHVTNVRWSHDDGYLLSTGGNDKCVFQWKAEDVGVKPPVEEAEVADDAGFDAAAFGFFEMEEDAGGDEFMAVKPWIGAIQAPSDPPRAAFGTPSANLNLEWVHGYSAQSTRNSLRYCQSTGASNTAKGDIVYPAAALGVVMEPGRHRQRFHRNTESTKGCTDDVLSLAVSPNGEFVALGERGRRPSIVVFNALTMRTVAVLSGHRRGVAELAFSNDGQYLVSCGLDNSHRVIVYHWSTGATVASMKGGTDKIMHVGFAPDDSFFVTVGIKHIYFWSKSRSGRSFRKKRGILGSTAKLQAFLCVAFVGDSTIVGAADGSLIRFDAKFQAVGVVPAHEGPVTAIYVDASSNTLLTGGADGVVKTWATSGSLTNTGSLALDSGVRSICAEPGLPYLIGTEHSEILQVGAALDDVTKVSEAHYAVRHHIGELWGLSHHPTASTYVTGGDDGTVRVWDERTHRQVSQTKLESLVRAVAYSPDGAQIAVALGGRLGGKEDGPIGQFHVLDASSLEVVHTGKDTEEWIQDVKWSPDGATLAVASHDNKIYLYDVAGGFSLKATCGGHSSYITHIDFTADSKFLQSNCGAYELLFWDAESGEQNPSGASELKDAEWSSWTCTLGWPVQGIWPAYADGTDINSVDRSPSGAFLATADDSGKIKLFNYPADAAGASFRSFDGHSSHVTNVRFKPDDTRVVSVGGNDRCVFEWTFLH